MVILDTCALIEICKQSPSFSTKTMNLMSKGSYLLSISFAELACKIKVGKIEMSMSIDALYKEFNQLKDIEIVNISTSMWLDSIDLEWPDNKDPTDRLITTFAMSKQLPLVTSDKKIKQFYKRVIW